MPHKRRVAHDVVQFLGRDNVLPVDAQGVAFDDVGIAFQGQEVDVHVDDAFGLLHHLIFGDPEGGLGDGHGEVVDLDAVELPDGHLDGVVMLVAECDLPVLQQTDDLIFQLAEAEVSLSQKVARAAGGVQKDQGSQLFLEGFQPALAGGIDGDVFDLVQLAAQAAQKQRVDHLVDVLDGGVVHPARAAGLGVQGALEHRAEDGGADVPPVEVLADVVQQQVDDLLVEPRNLDTLIREQSAVHIGEGGQLVLHVGVAVSLFGVQHPEQLDQLGPDVGDVPVRHFLEIVVELAVPAEDAGVLGIEAEHQPDAEHIQAFQAVWISGVLVLRQNFVVECAHQLAGLEGNFHFLLDIAVAGVHQELQAIIFLFQVLEIDDLRFAVGALHVVDVELGKVAGDHPPRVLGNRQLCDVPLGLLERGQLGPVRLGDGLAQVLAQALLLDHDMGGGDGPVDEAGVVEVHLLLKGDEILRMFHPIYIAQQREPEGLTVAFFISAVFPDLGKALRGGLLVDGLFVWHGPAPLWCFYRADLCKV